MRFEIDETKNVNNLHSEYKTCYPFLNFTNLTGARDDNLLYMGSGLITIMKSGSYAVSLFIEQTDESIIEYQVYLNQVKVKTCMNWFNCFSDYFCRGDVIQIRTECTYPEPQYIGDSFLGGVPKQKYEDREIKVYASGYLSIVEMK